jgi:hypothetical protein
MEPLTMADKLKNCMDGLKALADSAAKIGARLDSMAAKADANRHGYDPTSVNLAIAAQNRSGRGRIGGRERKAIHALLKGRQASPEALKAYKTPDKETPRKDANTAYERDLQDHEPRVVHGVKGVKSTDFKKKFPHQAAQDKFFDHPDNQGNYEIHRVEKVQ